MSRLLIATLAASAWASGCASVGLDDEASTGGEAAELYDLSFYPGDTTHHQVGRRRADRGWEVDVSYAPGQYLTYGPYTRDVPRGEATAVFVLALDNVSADDLLILSLDVYDAGADRLLAQRDLQRNAFAAPDALQEFHLPFTNDAGGPLELRVFWHGNSYARHALTRVVGGSAAPPPAPTPTPTPSPVPGGFDRTYLPGQSPHHQVGRPAGDGWEVDVSFAPGQFLTYGPYTTDVPLGAGRAVFTLALDNVTADTLPIVSLDVFDAGAGRVVAGRELRRDAFAAAHQSQDFALDFDNAGGSLEFRVFWHGSSYALHSRTRVTAGGGTTPPTPPQDLLDALWHGQAHFQYVRTLEWPAGESSGWVAVKDGAWYVFNRDTSIGPRPSYCSYDYAQTVVRRSVDRGRTWSDKVVVAEPSPVDPSSECAILDGSTYYDGDSDTWHLLTQCLGRDVSWRLCHFTRRGASPMGPFTPDPRNPAVAGGELWQPICGGDGKSCTSNTFDEGTPEILYKRDGYYYVTFHGYDGGQKTGYRGVARTQNFLDWSVQGGGLPGDAMFSPRDCQAWNPGCIGGGAAASVFRGGTHYMLIEAPDLNLACTEGQWWVFGLMRGSGLPRSGGWESFPRNPLLTPPRRRPCGLQYARFIEDGPDRLFMMYEDLEKGRRLFELVPGGGPALVE